MGYLIVEQPDTYTDPSVTYRVSHGIYKYTPLDLNTPNCPSAGDTILRTGNVGRAWTRVAFGSEAGTLSLYPEVAYTMYIEANNNIFEIQNSLL